MTDVLVDTSVWVHHFRKTNTQLIELLNHDRVLGHPLVTGELACGTPPNRIQTLRDINDLRKAQQASLSETLSFIEDHRIFGYGCGLIDLMLLASTLETVRAKLWTHDQKLDVLARRFGVQHCIQSP